MNNGQERTIRTFVAVDIPENIRKTIRAVQGKLPKFKGKHTELENLHLTLKFLGHITEKQIEEVKKRLGKIRFKEFETQIDRIGVFSPRIVWLHMANCLELQKEVDEALSDIFEKERRFMGHITIARVKFVKNRKAFLQKLQKIKTPSLLKFKIKNFKLKKSIRIKKGHIYEDMETYLLGQ